MKKCISDQQIAIIRLAAKGLINEAIAYELKVSKNTVKYHKKQIFMILNVSSMTEALSYAYEKGIIKL